MDGGQILLSCIKVWVMLVGETTCGGFETLGEDKTQSFISRTK